MLRHGLFLDDGQAANLWNQYYDRLEYCGGLANYQSYPMTHADCRWRLGMTRVMKVATIVVLPIGELSSVPVD